MKNFTHKCQFGPPAAVWVKSVNGWYQRAWKTGEREKYMVEVLGW